MIPQIYPPEPPNNLSDCHARTISQTKVKLTKRVQRGGWIKGSGVGFASVERDSVFTPSDSPPAATVKRDCLPEGRESLGKGGFRTDTRLNPAPSNDLYLVWHQSCHNYDLLLVWPQELEPAATSLRPRPSRSWNSIRGLKSSRGPKRD